MPVAFRKETFRGQLVAHCEISGSPEVTKSFLAHQRIFITKLDNILLRLYSIFMSETLSLHETLYESATDTAVFVLNMFNTPRIRAAIRAKGLEEAKTHILLGSDSDVYRRGTIALVHPIAANGTAGIFMAAHGPMGSYSEAQFQIGNLISQGRGFHQVSSSGWSYTSPIQEDFTNRVSMRGTASFIRESILFNPDDLPFKVEAVLAILHNHLGAVGSAPQDLEKYETRTPKWVVQTIEELG